MTQDLEEIMEVRTSGKILRKGLEREKFEKKALKLLEQKSKLLYSIDI